MRSAWVRAAAAGLLLLAASPAAALESTSYRLDPHALNSGGDPRQATILASAGYRITLDAIGDPIAGVGLGGPSFTIESGWIAAGRPPGEVTGLVFLADGVTLEWDPAPAAGSYNLYRGALGGLSAGYGSCLDPRLTGTSTADGSAPPASGGYAYLVTVSNPFGEEGTLGYTSGMAERPNILPCP
jgi:hypothetical protein